MTRHLADHTRSRGTSRLRAYLAQDRKAAPSAAALNLQTRPRQLDGQVKTSHFMRIAVQDRHR